MSIRVLHIELGVHLQGGAEQVAYLINALEHHGDISLHLVCAEDSEIHYTAFGQCETHTIKSVSYTHLTLPTICSV